MCLTSWRYGNIDLNDYKNHNTCLASSRSFLRSALEDVANNDGKDIHSSRSFLLDSCLGPLSAATEDSVSFSTHSSSLDDDFELLRRLSFLCFLLFFFDFLSCLPLNYIINYLYNILFGFTIHVPFFCL